MKWNIFDVLLEPLSGTCKDYMQNRYNLNYKFSYDYSNRLLNAQNINQGDNTYSVFNTYDKDGNLTTLKRYGDNNILADNFIYTYSPGTNKLTRVSGATDQFSHDLNGNTILDELNGNYNILYDHRNLPAAVGVPKSLLLIFEFS